jgi:hypothetical protein
MRARDEWAQAQQGRRPLTTRGHPSCWGGEVSGAAGVDKRIATLTTAVAGKLTVERLAALRPWVRASLLGRQRSAERGGCRRAKPDETAASAPADGRRSTATGVGDRAEIERMWRPPSLRDETCRLETGPP